MSPTSPLLTQLIDDYVLWFVDWHRAASGDRSHVLQPPARFATWHSEAVQSLAGEQPALEHLNTMHDQLHTLVKLVLIKTPTGQKIDHSDDESVIIKYMELMHELRRFERAFAQADSDLDPLTGLRTRTAMKQDLEREISRTVRTRRPFFVAIMDIDHFKKVNDTYGHESGDRVLAAVANQISGNLRIHDDAYRIGGEEFLLCLKETDAAGSFMVLERLRLGLEKKPVALTDGKTVPITASFGMATCTAIIKPDSLLRKADEALYRAKHEGRNRVVIAN